MQVESLFCGHDLTVHAHIPIIDLLQEPCGDYDVWWVVSSLCMNIAGDPLMFMSREEEEDGKQVNRNVDTAGFMTVKKKTTENLLKDLNTSVSIAATSLIFSEGKVSVKMF